MSVQCEMSSASISTCVQSTIHKHLTRPVQLTAELKFCTSKKPHRRGFYAKELNTVHEKKKETGFDC